MRLAFANGSWLAEQCATVDTMVPKEPRTLHFLTRDAACSKALGAGTDESALTHLLAYPIALVCEEPALFNALAVLCGLALCASPAIGNC